MADESHLAQLHVEDLSVHDAKLEAWARSLDTTPERLRELLRADGDSSKHVRDLMGIR